MADKKNIERARLERQRLALLALAASEKKQTDECLAPEELAALLDGTCSKEQHRRFMDHFSGCDVCYREWLTLCRERDVRAEGTGLKKRVISFVSNRRFFAAAGSACAIAISVMIFWTTPFQQDERSYMTTEDTLFVPDTSREYKDRKAEVDRKKSGVLFQRKVKTEQSTGIEPQNDKVSGPVKIESSRVDSEFVAPQAAPPALKRSERNQAEGPQHLQEQALGSASDFAAEDEGSIGEYERFRTLALMVCRGGDVGDSNESALRKTGNTIRAGKGSYTVEQQVQVEKILELLDAAEHGTSRKKTCEQILQLITAGDN